MTDHITPDDIDYLKGASLRWLETQPFSVLIFYDRDQERMLKDLFAFLRKTFEQEEVNKDGTNKTQ